MSDKPQVGQLSGIGATSLGVALLRAVEDARSDRLVADPYARHIVAAGAARSDWGTSSVHEDGAAFLTLMADQVAVRTRFLDETLLRLTHAGCDQVAVLGCGMDTRAYRIDWPTGTRLFEVDFEEVLAFRDDTLAACGAAERCTRIAVAADLSQDWTSALHGAGFDATRPTAWLAEGLLYALDDGECGTLLDRITDLSAPGSTLAFDHLEDSPVLRSARAALSPELLELWRGGPTDLARWLTGSGWRPSIHELGEIAGQFGRTVPAELSGAVLATATLEGTLEGLWRESRDVP